jgi:Zn-dependent protease
LATLGIYKLLGASIIVSFHWLPVFHFIGGEGSLLQSNANLQLLLYVLFQINLYLNLLNLAPVFPLDGGQIARSLYLRADPWNGIKYSLWLSLIVAVAIALLFGANGETFALIFFGVLAVQNFQELQMIGSGGFGGGRRPW